MLDVNKLEAKMAKQDGAQVIKNSGRGMNKGDAKTDDDLIDYKFTDAKSFSLNVEAFKKHEKDAYLNNREPVIVAVFQQHKGKRIAMIDFEHYLTIEGTIERAINKGWRLMTKKMLITLTYSGEIELEDYETLDAPGEAEQYKDWLDLIHWDAEEV